MSSHVPGIPEAGSDAYLDDAVRRLVRRHNDILERACERMLTDPRGWGVLAHESVMKFSFDGPTYSARVEYRVCLSPSVPFGQIHLHLMDYDGTCSLCDEKDDGGAADLS